MDIKSDSGAVSEIRNILLEIGGKTILVIKQQRTWPVFQCFVESRNCGISNKFLAKETSKQSVTRATWFLPPYSKM